MVLRTYLIEDNPLILENLIGTLEELADVRAVGVADNEAEASQWLREHSDQWDLVIVDLFLKEGNGLGVVAACAHRLPRQRVIMLSNYTTASLRERCEALKVDAVFDKSNEIDALLNYCMDQSRSFDNREPQRPN